MRNRLPGYVHIGMALFAVVSLSAQDAEWTKRDEWQNVPGIFYAMGIDSTSVVADIGCQEGYLTIRLASRVSHVFSVDIDANALAKLRRRIGDSTRITTILGEVDDPKLPPDTLNAAVIVNAYHEMTEYKQMLRHIHRALKPKGRLVIAEPISQTLRSADRDRQTQSHRIGIAYVRKELQDAGFTIIGEKDPFVKREHRNDEMWIIVAEKGLQSN